MSEPLECRIQVFDPKQDFAIVERRLPHWSQAGTTAFITWRTWDSIPEAVLNEWLAERDEWLRRHGIEPNHLAKCRPLASREVPSLGERRLHLRERLKSLGPALLREFQIKFSNRWNDRLDECHGACVLRKPELSQVVFDSLMHFDGERYDLTDFVVMPNHVHILAAFPNEAGMLEQCESWKRYTAMKLNRALRRRGRFWQIDDFDHLVRSVEQFERLRKYIRDNPTRAKLHPGDYRHYAKQLEPSRQV
jgi:REP element-mobilizing transposase RayT